MVKKKKTIPGKKEIKRKSDLLTIELSLISDTGLSLRTLVFPEKLRGKNLLSRVSLLEIRSRVYPQLVQFGHEYHVYLCGLQKEKDWFNLCHVFATREDRELFTVRLRKALSKIEGVKSTVVYARTAEENRYVKEYLLNQVRHLENVIETDFE